MSSAIADFRFHFLTQQLQINFQDGSVYTYRDVSPLVLERFLNAKSMGGYFNSNIRNSHSFYQGEMRGTLEDFWMGLVEEL